LVRIFDGSSPGAVVECASHGQKLLGSFSQMRVESTLIIEKIRICLDAYEETGNLKYLNFALKLIEQIKNIESNAN